MKITALAMSLTAGLLATCAMAQSAAAQTAAAQTTTAQTTPQRPAAAATLPNSFDPPAGTQSASRATPSAPAQRTPPTSAPAAGPAGAPASAPDIARAETALREVITALKSGNVDYTIFSDDLAGKIRPQASQIGSLLTQLGDVKSITHKGQPDGVDLFRVEFANQSTEWVIGFDNDDQIAALLFRPAGD